MMKITWNTEKAKVLEKDKTRNNVGFEECVIAIENGKVLDDIPNPNYPHQRMFILEINNYAHVVPYVVEANDIFLKTVFPSRKHTAIYLTDKSHD
jgi:hypothetical protein